MYIPWTTRASLDANKLLLLTLILLLSFNPCQCFVLHPAAAKLSSHRPRLRSPVPPALGFARRRRQAARMQGSGLDELIGNLHSSLPSTGGAHSEHASHHVEFLNPFLKAIIGTSAGWGLILISAILLL
ncbi:hypothetical protein GUITHDRAFT_156471, partial [Guillardia theta CCMP2712]